MPGCRSGVRSPERPASQLTQYLQDRPVVEHGCGSKVIQKAAKVIRGGFELLRTSLPLHAGNVLRGRLPHDARPRYIPRLGDLVELCDEISR